MAKDRRNKILRAVEKMIEDRRFHEVTMDDVAKAAGVGKGTIYRYFKDKEDLFIQLAAEGLEALHLIVRDRILPEDLPFEKKLLLLCEELTEHGKRRHNLNRVARGEGCCADNRLKHSDVIHEKRMQVFEAISEVLARGKEQGKIRGDIEPKQAALLLHSMLMSRRHQQKGLEPLPLETVAEVYCHGICPRENGGEAG